MTQLSFDARTVAPAESRSLLPAMNKVVVAITGAELKATKAGTGSYIEIEYTLDAGPHKGRKIWGIYNYKNPNPQAQEIGQREFSAICHAVGRLVVNDTVELLGKRMIVDIAVKAEGPSKKNPADIEPARNIIRNWAPISSGMAPAGAPALPPNTASPPPPNTASAPPPNTAPAPALGAASAPWRRAPAHTSN